MQAQSNKFLPFSIQGHLKIKGKKLNCENLKQDY
jgi:hypothetical protein